MRPKPVSTFVMSFLVGLLLSFSLLNFAKAQTATIGVKVGDWVKYGEVMINWASTDPNAKPDQELVELNNTEWFKTVVTNVNYPRITFEHLTQFKDGTQESSVLQINVDSGSGNGTLFFVPSGLFLESMVYPSSIDPSPVFINETALRVYSDVSRLVNHLNLTNEQTIESVPSQNIYTSINHYWDRETGFLAERYGVFTNTTGSFKTQWTRSDKIVETNLWSGMETEPPRAVAGGNKTVYEDELVTFNANESSDNIGIISYNWLFGDATTGNGESVTHIYNDIGSYYAVLIVKDASGNMAFDAVAVTVEPSPSHQNGTENGADGSPLQNGSLWAVVGVAAILAMILITIWKARARGKRRIRLARRRASR